MNRRRIRTIAKCMAGLMAWQVIFPLASHAVTGGPSQPEVEGFQPIGTSDMVDLFTGDFHYNIPLLDVGGYPVNLTYNAGPSMDEEASWVGLGWNLNVGSINRNLRGLPDEFKGDQVKSDYYVKPNRTVGVTVGVSMEIIGKDKDEAGSIISKDTVGGFGFDVTLTHNNYTGWGTQLSPQISGILTSQSEPLTGNLGLGLNLSSQSGATVAPNASMTGMANTKGGKLSIETSRGLSTNINGRGGLRQLSVNAGIGAKYSDGDAQARILSQNTGLGNATVEFANPTYVPWQEHPMKSLSLSASVKGGLEVAGTFSSSSIGLDYAETWVEQKYQSAPAYGYFWLHEAKGVDNALMDFNREKEVPFTKNTPHLALPNVTQDQFTVSGQGVGGMFRARRGDAGIVSDPTRTVTSADGSGGVDLGGGSVVKFGADIQVNFYTQQSGREYDGMSEDAKLNYIETNPDEVRYEPFYLQMEGELKAADKELLDDLRGTDAAYVPLAGEKFEVRPSEDQLKSKSGTSPLGTGLTREDRAPRNYQVSFLTGEEATVVGQIRKIENYTLNGNGLEYTEEERVVPGQRPAHHPSEYTVLNPSGGRHVYGLPAYNNTQEDYSYAIGKKDYDDIDGVPDYDCATGLVAHNSTACEIDNDLGKDGFYHKQTLPAYAHSYLLTEMLSADYEDVGQDGPTADDLGSWVKFNYGKHSANYGWRAPYDMDKHDRGMKSDPTDDRASFVYGTKEIWYLKSIVTRDYIAVFDVEDRQDAKSSAGADGSEGSQHLQRLKSIRLYALHEYTADPLSAVPLKTVHFEHTYDLCHGTPNSDANTGGKLTLKKVWFTYRNSEKGTTNFYEFGYPTAGSLQNPDYNQALMDRWGTYSGPFTCGTSIDGIPYGDDRPDPADWNYTTQNKLFADAYAAAWSLNQISLPSGGKVNIEYESDDYAWVQDRPAMQMFQVAGVSKKTEDTPNSTDYLFRDNEKGEDRTRIYFDLQEEIPTSYDGERYLRERYFKGIEWLYFRFLVNLAKPGATPHYEHVPGYAEIEDYGMAPASGGMYTQAWVELKEVPIGDREESSLLVSPIAKAAWQNARIYQPDVVYPSHSTTSGAAGFVSACKGLLTFWDDIKTLFTSLHRVMREKEHGRDFLPEMSYIKLYNPVMQKMGGGHRVKKITLNDSWDNLRPGQEAFTYGTEYFYTDVVGEDFDGDGEVTQREVSSGVAQWEPLLGGDENPFRELIPYVNKNPLAADDRYYMEEPVGEGFFPGPSVGYGTVTVRNLRHEDVTKHATGYVRNEFYTARDFPTLTYETKLDKKRTTTQIGRLLGFGVRDYMTATEGFVVERNDMHGKPKAAWTFAEVTDGTPITPGKLGLNPHLSALSGVEYKYKEGVTDDGRRRLMNMVHVIDPNGDIMPEQIGLNVDVSVDSRGSKMVTRRPKMGLNVDGVSAAPPVAIPTAWPWMPTQTTQFQSVSTMKVIDRSGILDKVIAHDRQAQIPTENLLWDELTGEVLLTRTWNEFKEPIYSLAMPAHWAYEGMGPAWQNQGLVLKDVYFYRKDVMEFPVGFDVEKYFEPGDEIYRQRDPEDDDEIVGPYWVNHIDPTLRRVYLVNELGFHNDHLVTWGPDETQMVKVLRSGHRNMSSAGIQSVTLKDNPMVGSTYPLSLDLTSAEIRDEVLAAGAVEYSDVWKMQCSKGQWSQSTVTITDPGSGGGGSGGGVEAPCGETTLDKYEALLNNMVAQNCFQRGYSTGMYLVSPDFADYPTQLHPILHPVASWYPTASDHELDRYNVTASFGWYPEMRYEIVVDDPTSTAPDDDDERACTIVLNLKNKYFHFPEIISFDNLRNKPGDDHDYWVDVTYKRDGDDAAVTHSVELLLYCPCGGGGGGASYIDATVYHESYDGKGGCSTSEDDFVNPWLNGLRGHYRTKASYAFLEDRVRNLAGGTDVREGGKLEDYVPLWWNATGSWLPSGKSDGRWAWTGQAQEFHPLGMEVQSEDALHNHGAVLTGYNESLVTLAGQNATRRELLFDGFEDYVLKSMKTCLPYHWRSLSLVNQVSTEEAHTGIYSLKMTSGIKKKPIRITGLADVSEAACTATTTVPQYTVANCDCMETFTPPRGKTYVVSAWVKEQTSAGPTPWTYTVAHLKLQYLDASGDPLALPPVLLRPSGPVIEGWQRIEAEVEIPLVAEQMNLTFESPGKVSYLDDLKIAPYDAVTNSYVYDPVNRRLVAELDHNHFATFYEYDEEGALIRVKKESERGVQTLTETRGNLTKQ